MIKKNIFNNQFSQILILLIFSLFLLSLERVLIFVLNFDYFNNLSLNIVFLSFLQGLRIDLITILTFAGIFILSAPFVTKYRKIILNSWLVVFLIIFTINLIDIAYFPYVHRHIVNELALLTNDLSFVFSVVPSYKFEIIFLILALFVIVKSWQKIINRPIIILELSTSKKITIFLFLSIFIFLGIRGKSSGKPFGLSDAFVNSQIESANLALNGFYSIYRSKKHIKYNFSLNGMDFQYSIFFSDFYIDTFEKAPEPEPTPTQETSSDTGGGSAPQQSGSSGSNLNLTDEEIRNISLLLDVKLPVKVRIGTKEMLLRDVLTMDIGSVVELNQLANDPLDILVDNHVIAQGEVVIVDGNFGVQITTIGTKRERLAQLKS